MTTTEAVIALALIVAAGSLAIPGWLLDRLAAETAEVERLRLLRTEPPATLLSGGDRNGDLPERVSSVGDGEQPKGSGQERGEPPVPGVWTQERPGLSLGRSDVRPRVPVVRVGEHDDALTSDSHQVRFMMAMCDEGETYQIGDGSVYDPVLIKVSEAVKICARLADARLAAETERADVAEAAVEAVRELHCTDGYRHPTCHGCGMEWPCLTEQTICAVEEANG